MKGDASIIDLLNELLTHELTAINEYYIHARMCENWGYTRLWKKLREESIEEMRHADALIARILFLDGLPNLQRLGKVNVGENVKEMFDVDLVLEQTAVSSLNAGIARCRDAGDNGSRALLEKLLVDAESHVDWIEQQRALIASVGLERYLAEQMGGDA